MKPKPKTPAQKTYNMKSILLKIGIALVVSIIASIISYTYSSGFVAGMIYGVLAVTYDYECEKKINRTTHETTT